MKLSQLLNRCLNQAYKVLAITLVLLAVAISGLRLMLPYAENYRLNLQNYLNESYQLNIIIGNLDAGWQQLGPSLVAKNVSLLQTDEASIFIDRIDFNVDFWASIKARQFITSNFTLSGAKIFVDKTLLETQADQSTLTTPQSTKNNIATLRRVSDLFLTQIEHFSLRSSDIIVRTSTNKEHKISLKQLSWKNNDLQHYAQGDVIFGNLSAKNLKLQLSLRGYSQDELAGNIYLEGNNLDITPWLGKFLKIEHDKISSAINFKSWISLKKGNAEKIQLLLGENTINWQYKESKHQLSLAQGQFVGKFHHGLEHFQLSSTPLAFKLDQQVWQPIIVQTSAAQETLSGYFSGIQLQNLAPLLPLFIDDKIFLAKLAQLSPRGKISNIYLQKHATYYDLAAEFNDLTLAYSQGIPGIENLSGDLLMSGDSIRLAIKAKQGQLDFDKHFAKPFTYQYLSAVFNAKFARSAWQITSDNILFKSPELALNASLSLTIPNDGLTKMSLFAQLSDVDAKNAKHYFPNLLMGEDLVGYLHDAILSGNIPQAKVLFNGPLAKFPFEDHSGIFIANAELTNSSFKFDPLWPEIKDFHANLNFTNNSMVITGRAGNILGVDVKGVKAEIADLSGEQKLLITSDIVNAPVQAISAVMMKSPLKNSVGKTLEQLSISDVVNGNFTLDIPLQTPEQTVASGTIDFNDNQLALRSPAMNFDKVNGQLTFVNDKISVNNLSLNWLNMPLSVSVNANNKADFYQTDIKINANWLQPDWQAQVPELLHSYLQGKLNWQAELSLFIPENGDFSYQLTLNSDLNALQLNLPTPYAKAMNKNLPLIASAKGRLKQSTIEVKLGQQLSFYGELAHQSAHFSRAHLVLGKEQMLLPMNGFHITTNLAQANFSEWQPLISNIIASVKQVSANNNVESSTSANVSNENLPLLSVPERIRGNIKKLDFYGQNLSELSFNLFDKKAWWLLQLNAKEVRSQVKIYPDWLEQGLDIDADFLQLSVKEDLGAARDKSEVINNDGFFASFPAMKVHCDNCRYGQLDLGKVDFSVVREANNILSLHNFVAKRGKNKLMLDGSWLHNKQQSVTEISGELHVKDIKREIENFGFASIIKDSSGKVNFNLNWQNGPQNFSLAHLNGDLSTKVNKGVLKISDDREKLARIASFLSLDSLVRKLTLDFRDIFSDGMFYSHIKGDFNLKDGVLYTENMRMKGSAGDLLVKGNTQLAAGKLDYSASYKPNVTSNLPVIAWIATLNPVTFLAGVAIDQVFTSAVITEMKFEITGDVINPRVVKVDSKTRNIRVGRSTPPQFVDNIQNGDDIKDSSINNPVIPLKQKTTTKDKTEKTKTDGKVTKSHG
jgi:uncharacterized protein (TIGR02099 family)